MTSLLNRLTNSCSYNSYNPTIRNDHNKRIKTRNSKLIKRNLLEISVNGRENPWLVSLLRFNVNK